MTGRLITVLCAGVVFQFHGYADAAQIEAHAAGGSGAFITVDGDIRADDGDRFTALFLSSGATQVVFNSNGGSLLAAVEIGRAIRIRGNVATYVSPSGICASACALAWLGGSKRFMLNDRQIGFHAAFTEGRMGRQISSNGNAIVGAYLSQLGLSIPTISYITKESPADMLWLTFPLADALQIDVLRGSSANVLLGKREDQANQTDAHAARKTVPLPPSLSRGILYEEGQTAGAQGAALNGDVKWEMVYESIDGAPAEPIVRATIAVPERQATATITFRRNRDKALPASHLIEVAFELPPEFPGGDISDLPGLIMKMTEDARGDALMGASARVSDGLFWIALSATGADTTHNLELLKDRGWIDVPMRYGNGRRAILTVEKGTAGNEAIRQVVKAWAVEGAH